MDESIKFRIKNQILKFEATFTSAKVDDLSFTLDFDNKKYRQDELVGLIRDVVPYFALTEAEINSIDKSELNKRSFTRISDANKSSKGDYGELLLFIILGFFYDVPKFVTKARLRSTTREQIKGFDCAHFSIESGEVTLWLGEAKFHQSISSAISSSFSSLNDHLNDHDKIKSELKLLGGEMEINKSLDKASYDALKPCLSGGKSLDKVKINVPVLLTYDSKTIIESCDTDEADTECSEFREKLLIELEKVFTNVYAKTWPLKKNIKIIFLILPLQSVADLKSKIDLVETAMKF